MSKNYLRKYFADYGIITLGVFALLFGGLAWHFYSRVHDLERVNASTYAETKGLADCAREPDWQEALACVIESNPTAYTQSSEYYDLKAQQDMAKWALLMMIVTGIGVVYIAATLREANQTAKLASDTLIVTKQMLLESAKTTEITRQSVEVQEREFALNRAWIYPGLKLDTLITDENANFFGQRNIKGFVLSYPLLNIGKKAAFDLEMVAHQHVGITTPPRPLIYPSPSLSTKITPPDGRAFTIQIMLSDEQIELLDNEAIRAFSYFRVTYRDGITSESRMTEVVLQIRVNGMLTHRDGSKIPGWEIDHINAQEVVT